MTVERALSEKGITVIVYDYPLMRKEAKVVIDTTKHDSEIRADERAKTIDEMAKIIRKIEADTSHCLFDCPKADEPITCTICVLERAVEQMKGDKNEN